MNIQQGLKPKAVLLAGAPSRVGTHEVARRAVPWLRWLGASLST